MLVNKANNFFLLMSHIIRKPPIVNKVIIVKVSCLVTKLLHFINSCNSIILYLFKIIS